MNSVVSDAAISYIGDEMTPHLKNADYDQAIETAVSILSKTIREGKFEESLFPWFTFMLFGFLFLLVAVGEAAYRSIKLYFKKKRDYTRRQRNLEEMERLVRERRTVESPMCPICLEEFTPDAQIDILQCGHKFHLTCLEEWLDKKDECPICRRRTPREDEEGPPESRVEEREDAVVDMVWLQFARSQLYVRYNYWSFANYRTAFMTAPRGSLLGGSSTSFSGFGGGFGGGGGGGSW